MNDRDLSAIMNGVIESYLGLKKDEAVEEVEKMSEAGTVLDPTAGSKEDAKRSAYSRLMWDSLMDVQGALAVLVANYFTYLDREKILRRETCMKMWKEFNERIEETIKKIQESIDKEGRIKVAQTIPTDMKPHGKETTH